MPTLKDPYGTEFRKQHNGERPGNSELLRKDANHGKLLNPWLLFLLRTVGFENRSPLSIRRRKTKQKNSTSPYSFQIQQILCFTLKRTYVPPCNDGYHSPSRRSHPRGFRLLHYCLLNVFEMIWNAAVVNQANPPHICHPLPLPFRSPFLSFSLFFFFNCSCPQ